jgi:hypothetical protein
MVLRGPPGYGFCKSIYEQASGWVGVWVGSLALYGFAGSERYSPVRGEWIEDMVCSSRTWDE